VRRGGPLRVLCAPNALKGTLPATEAAAAMAQGVRDAGGEPVELPMADGGDGTLAVLMAAVPAERRLPGESLAVTGPLGGRRRARWGWIDAGVAVVELAEASGLRLLRGRLEPLRATSAGTGELIVAAVGRGATRIVVGVGGSACTDGGAGVLQALGVELRDRHGRAVGRGGGALVDLASADASGLDPWLRNGRVEVAVDVDSPLLGPEGAAARFGPQKGATAGDIERLEAGLDRLASVLERDLGVSRRLRQRAGAGAAGGCAYGLAAIGAELRPGARLVADSVGLDAALRGCRLALTAEGRLDDQTGSGKAPAEVARRARAHRIPCVAIAGQVASLPDAFAAAFSLERLAEPGEDPRRHTKRLLRRAAAAAVERYRGGAAWATG
jgi:glycerate kinase